LVPLLEQGDWDGATAVIEALCPAGLFGELESVRNKAALGRVAAVVAGDGAFDPIYASLSGAGSTLFCSDTADLLGVRVCATLTNLSSDLLFVY